MINVFLLLQAWKLQTVQLAELLGDWNKDSNTPTSSSKPLNRTSGEDEGTHLLHDEDTATAQTRSMSKSLEVERDMMRE